MKVLEACLRGVKFVSGGSHPRASVYYFCDPYGEAEWCVFLFPSPCPNLQAVRVTQDPQVNTPSGLYSLHISLHCHLSPPSVHLNRSCKNPSGGKYCFGHSCMKKIGLETLLCSRSWIFLFIGSASQMFGRPRRECK